MLEPTIADIKKRMLRDNPWWEDLSHSIINDGWPRRAYFKHFYELASNTDVRRATVLMGPRRVGKTVLLQQFVQELIRNDIHPGNILYVSVDSPIYSGITLEKFLNIFQENEYFNRQEKSFLIFDEIQYLAEWEVHLKDLVDSYPESKFIVSGSAAAALKLKSQESGAGRFSDFFLPPLTFAEYISFTGASSLIKEYKYEDEDTGYERVGYTTDDINNLNREFINYLNYGGYPEAVLLPDIRKNADQFVKNDIIDKVLLKDLPALYGINNIQELNRLFSFIAFNAGQEINLNALSQRSGLSKPSIAKYITYLESAFLIQKVSRLDGQPRRFQRETNFKLYLTNPSMRAALFTPVTEDEPELVGHLTESAIYSQWFHSTNLNRIFYARWKSYEIDIVYLTETEHIPDWVVEVKWSDKVVSDPKNKLAGCFKWFEEEKIEEAMVTTKTVEKSVVYNGFKINFIPSALYCYAVGRNLVKSKDPSKPRL